jgi:transcriptional regulator with XRE-family HTH domain
MSKHHLSAKDKKRIEYISTFLKELRINSGLTQTDVAFETGLSRNFISKLERGGVGTVMIKHLFLLIDFYEIKLSELFQDLD